jgi:hypothetical protein
MEQADIKVARVPLGGVLEPHDGPDLDAGAGLAQALRKVAKPLHDEREVKAYPAMQGETDNGSMTLGPPPVLEGVTARGAIRPDDPSVFDRRCVGERCEVG